MRSRRWNDTFVEVDRRDGRTGHEHGSVHPSWQARGTVHPIMSMPISGQPAETEASNPLVESSIHRNDRRSIRRTFTTRVAKIVFFGTFAVVTLAAAVWTAQQPLPSQFGLLMGTAVGYMAMGVFVAAVAGTIVTAVVVGLPRLASELLQLGRN